MNNILNISRFLVLVLFLVIPLSGQIQPAALQLVEKYNVTTGGTENKSSINSVTFKGEWEMLGMGLKGPATIYTEKGKRFGLFLDNESFGLIRNCYVEGNCWVDHPAMGLRKVEGGELLQMQKSSILFPEIDISSHYKSAQVLETNGIERRSIVLKDDHGYQETWVINSQTGLLEEVSMPIDAGVRGNFSIKMSYDQFQPKNGVLYPRIIYWKTPVYEVKVTITEVLIDSEIDPNLFSPVSRYEKTESAE